MRKMLFLLVAMFVGLQVFAQNVITGVVTDQGGDPIPGANVMVKGVAGKGTITNIDGKYSLKVPASAEALVFSFVGMETQEIQIGGKAVINVQMQSESIGVDEVVVTALGVKVSKDKLTSSVTTVKGDNLNSTGESGVIQSLSGKTSGLTIIKNTGDPGAGAYMQIRGQNTITGSTQPLIIIDGVPMSNSSIGGGVDGVVQQSRMNDLNPADIESVEVLKGASASAVWGTRAANGVIVITTKQGKYNPKKQISVSLYASYAFDAVSVEAEKQDMWGQGKDGVFVANRGESWGDKISARAGGADAVDKSGAYFLSDNGNKYYPITEKRSKKVYNDVNRNQVFRTGVTRDIGGSISSGNQNSNTFFSFSNWDQKGIIRGNSDYKRTTLRLNYSTNITNKLKLRLNTFYSNISSNRIQQGSNLNGLYLGYLRTSPDFDNTDYKGTYYNAAGVPTVNSHRGYRRYLGDGAPTYNNPGWTMYEQVNTSDVERIIINPELNYKIVENSKVNSNLTARLGLDFAKDDRVTFFPVNSAGDAQSGSYKEDHIFEKQGTFDLFVRTMHTISSDFNFSWILGGQYSGRYYKSTAGSMSNFINPVDQIYDYENATAENRSPSQYLSDKHVLGGYLVLNFDILNQFLVESTVRAEKSNAFADVIIYPSVSLGWQFTKIMAKNDILTFGKLRAAYGTVGVEPPLYISRTDIVAGSTGDGWGTDLSASHYGGSLQKSSVQGNPDIEPERKTEIEVGMDLRLLKNRVTINASYYSNKTEGAIFAVDVPASTGYTSQLDNAATLTNKGIELDVVGTVIKTKDFKWDLLLNFSKNKNMVEDLKGTKSIFLNGFTGTSSRAVEGQPLGVLWGGVWDRDASGKLILDANGFPQQALEEGVLGDPNPDWRGGLGTNLNYKGFGVNVLFDASQGGDAWAGTHGVLNHFGIAPVTANEVKLTKDVVDYGGVTHAAGTTVRGNLKNFGAGDVLLNEAWYTGLGGGFGPVAEQFVHDASWIRLREVGVSYSLPTSLLSKVKLTNLVLSASARNVFLWSDFADKYGTDPETNLTGVSNGRGLDYFNNPSTRSVFFKIQIGF